ncbi:MAG: hypothetical protein ACYC6B_09025 [Thermoleophilia bacterium]
MSSKINLNMMPGDESHPTGRLYIPVMLTAAIMLVLLISLWLLGTWYKEQLLQDRHAEIASKLGPYAGLLVSEVDRRDSEIKSLAVLAKNSDQVTAAEFKSYVKEVKTGVHNVNLYSLTPEELYVYRYPDTGPNSSTPEDPRLSRNSAVRAGVERTIASASTSVVITEMENGKLHLEVWLAIFKNNELWGLANSTYDLDSIFSTAGLAPSTGGINLVVKDNFGELILGDDNAVVDPETQPVPLPDGNWQLIGAPSGGLGGDDQQGDDAIHHRWPGNRHPARINCLPACQPSGEPVPSGQTAHQGARGITAPLPAAV